MFEISENRQFNGKNNKKNKSEQCENEHDFLEIYKKNDNNIFWRCNIARRVQILRFQIFGCYRITENHGKLTVRKNAFLEFEHFAQYEIFMLSSLLRKNKN